MRFSRFFTPGGGGTILSQSLPLLVAEIILSTILRDPTILTASALRMNRGDTPDLDCGIWTWLAWVAQPVRLRSYLTIRPGTAYHLRLSTSLSWRWGNRRSPPLPGWSFTVGEATTEITVLLKPIMKPVKEFVAKV